MKISMASDHGGYRLKDAIAEALKSDGHEVEDFGVHSPDSVDYPDYAKLVGSSVTGKKSDFGVLICTTGIGMSIAANKIPGVRAALCHNEDSAEFGRRHNNANVICMGAKYVGAKLGIQMVKLFMRTEFEGGRHANRVDKLERSC